MTPTNPPERRSARHIAEEAQRHLLALGGIISGPEFIVTLTDAIIEARAEGEKEGYGKSIPFAKMLAEEEFKSQHQNDILIDSDKYDRNLAEAFGKGRESMRLSDDGSREKIQGRSSKPSGLFNC